MAAERGSCEVRGSQGPGERRLAQAGGIGELMVRIRGQPGSFRDRLLGPNDAGDSPRLTVTGSELAQGGRWQ